VNTRKTVGRQDWLVARKKILEMEKALSKARDELTAARRELPQVKIEKDYVFQGGDCRLTLADLFGTHSQLIVQHFMFAADWDAGCPSCSFWADCYNGITEHLKARDIAMVVVSSAPVSKLLAFRERMGWSFQWVSCADGSFNQDFGVSFTPEHLDGDDQPNYNFGSSRFNGPEAPGISVFEKVTEETIYHTYSTYARGLDVFNPAYQLMDITPKGRAEHDLAHTMAWVRRHDEY